MNPDPYLETREKEDAFLKRITEVIEQGLRFAPVGMPLRFQLGKDAKAYIGKNTDIQTNKISEETLLKATREFLENPPVIYLIFSKFEKMRKIRHFRAS